ncbi:helix-turn-helix domain-containing protein [Aeromonas enteropelogenes]|uniref:helix-turn-helix domain-containing protein n=1 Tax=Aeromonas enteropelogenes TaxID=29489 RepID=UPI003B9EB4F7
MPGGGVINVAQHTLGHIVGATRPRVNEVLKQLDGAGIICLGRGKITLLRPDLLQAKLAPGDYPYHLPKVV